MPERGFATETWDEDWFQALDSNQKYLFLYLSYNNHCTAAGVYHITPATMAFDTKMSIEQLPEVLRSLSPHAEWYPEQNYIWVRDFIKRQLKSPKFLVAVAKALKLIKNNGLIKEVVAYNLREYTISIPYQYRIDTPTASASSAVSASDKGVGGVKGEGELSPEEEEINRCLVKLKGWQADEDDVHWLQGLRSELPGFTLAELKVCVDYYSGRAPPKHKGIWKNRFRNWMIKKQEFERREKAGGQPRTGVRPKPKQGRVHPIRRIPGD